MTMSLQAKLDAFKVDFEAGKPPYSVPHSVIEAMHRATAELIASGAADRALKVGDKAPSFSLKDPAGNVVSSAELLKTGPLVVRKSVRDNKLGFPILSDAHGDVAAAFGLRFSLPGYLIDVYKGLKNNLPVSNDDPSWTLPMPARYVIGQDGTILYANVNPDYTHRPEPEELLPALDRAASAEARERPGFVTSSQ
jgi:peroxiredoxin